MVRHICAITFSMSLLCMAGHVTDHIWRPEIWQTLHFFQDRKHFIALADPSKVGLTTAALTICLACNLVEFVCFVLIFLEMHEHHKRHVSLCLANKPAIVRDRPYMTSAKFLKIFLNTTSPQRTYLY